MTTEHDRREHWLKRAKAAALLDAAFLVHYYNSRARHQGPQPSSAAIEVSEVFSDVEKQEIQEVRERASKLLSYSVKLGLAFYKYAGATRTYEEEFNCFVNENPDFSDESYNLVASIGMLDMR